MTDTKYTKECYLCGLRDKDLNDVDTILNTPIVHENLKCSISSLRACIRCFECLLHLSYKLLICQGRVNVIDGTKDIYEEYKKYIQKEFKDKMGLIVDQPVQESTGNSTDGNMARKFFSNEQKNI